MNDVKLREEFWSLTLKIVNRIEKQVMHTAPIT